MPFLLDNGFIKKGRCTVLLHVTSASSLLWQRKVKLWSVAPPRAATDLVIKEVLVELKAHLTKSLVDTDVCFNILTLMQKVVEMRESAHKNSEGCVLPPGSWQGHACSRYQDALSLGDPQHVQIFICFPFCNAFHLTVYMKIFITFANTCGYLHLTDNT